MKKKLKSKVVGYGYTSTWSDGTLGWWLPYFISKYDTRRNPSRRTDESKTTLRRTDRLYLCRITIEPVVDKRGRHITRKPKVSP